MKAFEEWWLMEGQNIVGHYDQQERYLASDVWKAALEWALTFREPDHTDLFENINPMWIKKELKCL